MARIACPAPSPRSSSPPLSARARLLLGWSWPAGLVFGLALSVASTVVMLRAFQERHLVDTERGRIAVGWLVVEDLVMVLALVLLPTLAGVLAGEHASDAPASRVAPRRWPSCITLAKVAAFVAADAGGRPARHPLAAALHRPHRLARAVPAGRLAIALGVAFGAAELFDVSFALGAFFAGMIMGESDLSQQAAEETLPLRDAFAVLFFVSVGMLFDPVVADRRAAGARRHRGHHRRRQVARRLRDRARFRLPAIARR